MAIGRPENKSNEQSERHSEGSIGSAKNLNADKLLAQGGAALKANENKQDAAGNSTLAKVFGGEVQFHDSGNDKNLAVVQEKKTDSKLAGAPANIVSGDSPTPAVAAATELKGVMSAAGADVKAQVTEPLQNPGIPADRGTGMPNDLKSTVAGADVKAQVTEPLQNPGIPADRGTGMPNDLKSTVAGADVKAQVTEPLQNPGIPADTGTGMPNDSKSAVAGADVKAQVTEPLQNPGIPADTGMGMPNDLKSAIAATTVGADVRPQVVDLLKDPGGVPADTSMGMPNDLKSAVAGVAAQMVDLLKDPGGVPADTSMGMPNDLKSAVAGVAAQMVDLLKDPGGVPADTSMGMPNDLKSAVAAAATQPSDLLKNPGGIPADTSMGMPNDLNKVVAGVVSDLLKNPGGIPADTGMGMPNDLKSAVTGAATQPSDLLKNPGGLSADAIAAAAAAAGFSDMVNAANRAKDTTSHPQTPGEVQHPAEAQPKPENKQPSDKHEDYKVQPGDSLWKIAQKHLGEHAKAADIWNYIHKTAELNGIKNERLIASGATLKLPNDNDLHGTKPGPADTQKPGPVDRQKPGPVDAQKPGPVDAQKPGPVDAQKPGPVDAQKPGPVDAQKPGPVDAQKPGPVDAQKTGPVDAQKPGPVDAQKPGPVDAQKIDAARDKTADQAANSPEQQLQTQKDKLDGLMDAQVKNQHMDQAQEIQIKHNMQKFEDESKKLEETYRKQIHSDNPNMPPEQVAKLAHDRGQKEVAETYKQVSELFDKQSTVPGMTDQLQHKLAEQILYNAGHAKDLDQGMYNTCALMSQEKRTYMTNPAQAARLVKDTALHGEYITTHSGLSVPIDSKSLQPHDGADRAPQDGQRDYASQVFQVVAANVYLKQEHSDIQYQQTDVNGQPAYINGRPVLPFNDSGERLYNTKTHQYVTGNDGRLLSNPGDAANTSGQPIIDAEINCQPGQTPRSNPLFGGPQDYSGTQGTHSPQDMANKMKAALDHGDGPLILFIDDANPPMSKKPGGGHYVTIDSYTQPQYGKQGETPMFNLDNSWGKDNDHKFESVYNLYRLAGNPGQPMPGIPNDGGQSEFKNDAQQVEDLRSMYINNKISADDYQDALRQQVLATRMQMNSLTFRDEQTLTALGAELKRAIIALPADMQAQVVKDGNM